MNRDAAAYQAFYCEENIWRLAQTAGWDGEASVAFISNPGRRVALWSQRAGAVEDDGLVVWDYHVVLLGLSSPFRVWDLDSTATYGGGAADYLRTTFRRVPPVFSPRFRLVDAHAYASGFGSDRSHMRDQAGGFRSAPPPWPAPKGTALPLDRLLDPSALPECPWIDLAALHARLGLSLL